MLSTLRIRTVRGSLDTWLDRFVANGDRHKVQSAMRTVVGKMDVTVVWNIRCADAVTTTRTPEGIGVKHDAHKHDEKECQHKPLVALRVSLVVQPSPDAKGDQRDDENRENLNLATSEYVVGTHDLTRLKVGDRETCKAFHEIRSVDGKHERHGCRAISRFVASPLC